MYRELVGISCNALSRPLSSEEALDLFLRGGRGVKREVQKGFLCRGRLVCNVAPPTGYLGLRNMKVHL